MGKIDMLQKYKKELSSLLRPFRGEKNTAKTRKRISALLTEHLNYIKSMGVLGQSSEVTSTTFLWKSWRAREKVIWFFMNKLGFGRKEIQGYRDVELLIYSIINDLVADETERGNVLSAMLQCLKEKYYKYWYEDSPKSVMLVDCDVQLVAPAKCITLNFEI